MILLLLATVFSIFVALLVRCLCLLLTALNGVESTVNWFASFLIALQCYGQAFGDQQRFYMFKKMSYNVEYTFTLHSTPYKNMNVLAGNYDNHFSIIACIAEFLLSRNINITSNLMNAISIQVHVQQPSSEQWILAHDKRRGNQFTR